MSVFTGLRGNKLRCFEFYRTAIISKQLRNYDELSASVSQSVAKLNYAYNYAKKELPKLQEQIHTLTDKKNKYNKQLNEQQEKFEEKKDKLNQQIGKLKGYLEDIKKAKAHYDQIGIQQIISDCEQEPIVQAKKEETVKQRDILTRQYQDVETKYKQLVQQAESSKTILIQKKEAGFQGLRETAFAQKEDIRTKERKESESVAENFDNELAQMDAICKELLTSKAQFRSDLKHLQKDDFYREERKQAQDSLNEANSQITTNSIKLQHVQDEIAKMRSDYERQFFEIEEAQKQELEQAREELNVVTMTIEQLQQRIATLDRTFYGWLETNKSDWRDNIGKVVREEDVLFAESLNPSLSGQIDTSLFGVNIDVANNDYRPTDSDALKAKLQASQEALEKQKAEFNKLPIKHDEQQGKLRKEFKQGLKKKEDEEQTFRAQDYTLTAEIRKLTLSITQLEEQASDAYDGKKAELEKQINDLEQTILGKEKEKENAKSSKQRKLSTIKREYQKLIDEIEAELETKRQAKDAAIKSYELDCEKQLLSIRNDREKELTNKGVDTERLESLEKEIKQLDLQLQDIGRKKETVLEYNIKRRDLLNHESKYKHDLQKYNEILEKEKNEYDDNRTKLTIRRNEAAALLNNAQDHFEALRTGISKTDEIRRNDFYAELHVDTELESEENCSDLCETISSQYLNRSNLVDAIKSKVIKFKGKFKAPDRFGFEMTLASDKDFLSLAGKIRDFFEEEQYETYRNQVERTYAQIISVIAQEVGRINENKSKVQETILAINKDFAEKTFAGVIKLIKLEVKEEPDDPLMNVLGRIAEFVENNEGVAVSDIPLFASLTNDKTNREAVDLLKALTNQLHTDTRREELTLADVFKLRFTIQENDKLFEHVENLANIGSDGTDVLVKAIVNIMLISVFKTKARSKNDSFYMHCMMDEINRLHPSNIQGILQFASNRHIWIVNACPTTFNVGDYRHTYLLEKDDDSHTHINLLIDNNQI